MITQQFLYSYIRKLNVFLCRIFSPDAPCEVIEAEKHTNIFYPAEPDIWMVLVCGCLSASTSIIFKLIS